MRGRFYHIEGNIRDKTPYVPIILYDYGIEAVGGMYGVAVKCVEIIQNTDCEGSLPNYI